PYRSLSHLADVSSLTKRVVRDALDCMNFELGQLVYLYGTKPVVASHASWVASLLLNQLLPCPSGGKVFSIADRRLLLPEYRPCELAAGEAYFRPAQPADRAPFFDNLSEYRRRYRYVKWDTFVSQMEFFADLIDVAKSRGIHVVVVTMPITELNRSLIQDYAYDAYIRSVKALSRSKGASVIDLMGSQKFTISDFCDTVHLHAGGGKKMLDALITSLMSDSKARAALNLVSLREADKS
ncbi:MAG: hypothetical protein HY711_02755, partial [Candidatus Melainabacteria bacterium]|nr:hypothetical protein [Candidatus Melainabacteria bacterium]